MSSREKCTGTFRLRFIRENELNESAAARLRGATKEARLLGGVAADFPRPVLFQEQETISNQGIITSSKNATSGSWHCY